MLDIDLAGINAAAEAVKEERVLRRPNSCSRRHGRGQYASSGVRRLWVGCMRGQRSRSCSFLAQGHCWASCCRR
jgi:hypothetical protein